MTLLHPTETEGERRARIARLMVEAMQHDVDAQRELIAARVRGETEAVFRAELDSSEQPVEERRFRDQLQCTMIRAHRATEKMRVQIARSRELLGLN